MDIIFIDELRAAGLLDRLEDETDEPQEDAPAPGDAIAEQPAQHAADAAGGEISVQQQGSIGVHPAQHEALLRKCRLQCVQCNAQKAVLYV